MPCVREFALFVAMVERSRAACQRAVAVVEAEFLRTFVGLGAEVPFARDGRFVADGFKGRGERRRVPGETARALRAGDAKTAGIAASHERGAGVAAHRVNRMPL